MNKFNRIHLHIGDAVPHGNAAESATILALWQQAQGHFQRRRFSVTCANRSAPRTYLVNLDAIFLLSAMEGALAGHGSFDAWRQAHVVNAGVSLASALIIDVGCDDAAPGEAESYEVATLFLQQLTVALNLVQPGACRLLHTEYRGDSGHRYEAQAFDSKLYYGAFRNLRDLGWWQRHNPGFTKVWNWLEACEGSHASVALTNLDKVLFTAIKLAEQRDELSSRTALLVLYQLEMLLDCRNPADPRHLRNRMRLILGALPEAADCIGELYAARDGLLLGSRPVLRPPLIAHDSVGEFMEDIDRQNNAVELGTALVLVLLRELISNGAREYVFSEAVSFRPAA